MGYTGYKKVTKIIPEVIKKLQPNVQVRIKYVKIYVVRYKKS